MRLEFPLVLALGLACTAATAQQNPLARPAAPAATDLNGRWNGVNLERRSACANPQNDGSRGTYAQFDMSADAAGNFNMIQSGITGLNCTYSGRLQASATRLAVTGTYSCTDGKQGSITGGEAQVHPPSIDLRLSIRLSGSETCSIDALVSMARFPS